MKKIILPALLLLVLSASEANAQKIKYLRIRERPLVWFTFGCAKKRLYVKAKLDRIVKSYLNEIPGDFFEWGDRAFAFDLNGDGVEERFVPLDCGGTGNCAWGIYRINPVRLLGIITGQNFWIHKRQSSWSQITSAGHLNVSESILRTYRFKSGQYRSFGADFIESAYKNNTVKNLYLVEPTCDPEWIPKKRRKKY